MAGNFYLLIDRDFAPKVWDSKPESVEECVFKSGDYIGVATFLLSNVAPHIEWLIGFVKDIRKSGPKQPKRLVLRRTIDGEELDATNYSAEELAQILREWRC